MKWKPFNYQNNNYDLSHLHPFEFVTTQPAKDLNPEREYNFEVKFSLHCFTRKISDGDDPGLRYSDSRETRTFCFDRYNLSFYLPEIVRQIHTKRCMHTGHGNFFLVEIVTETGEAVEYEIYFDVTRPSAKGRALELFIQSAYSRSGISRQYRRSKKKIGFFVIAYNRKNGKPIKEPK